MYKHAFSNANKLQLSLSLHSSSMSSLANIFHIHNDAANISIVCLIEHKYMYVNQSNKKNENFLLLMPQHNN